VAIDVRRDIVLDAGDVANAQERVDALAERVARIVRRSKSAVTPTRRRQGLVALR
jgi:hypothetical protein